MNRSLGRNWLRVQIERWDVIAIANFFGKCPFLFSVPLGLLFFALKRITKDSHMIEKDASVVVTHHLGRLMFLYFLVF